VQRLISYHCRSYFVSSRSVQDMRCEDVSPITFLSESRLVAHGGCMVSTSTKGMSTDMSNLVCPDR
jgi:hypothetical protein